MSPELAAQRTRKAMLGSVGLVLLALAWELLGRFELLGPSWPPLSAVVALLGDPDRAGLFGRAIAQTGSAALGGYVIGIGAALALAAVAALAPPTRPGLDRFAALVNAIPIIALGPVFLATMSRPSVPVAVAAVLVFFTTFVATTAGFAAAARHHHDLFTVLGAGRMQRFRRLQLPAALPIIVSGFKIGAPSAVLGAILGEWFGAERGIGPLLVSAMQNYQIELLWAAALLSALMSMLAYGLMSIVEQGVVARYG